MSEVDNELPAGVITTAQAAKLLMVSEAWLGRLAKEGYIRKLDRGRWNLVSVVQGHIRFLKDEERRGSKNASHTRIQDIRAERLDLQLRAERRELVPMDDARLVLDTAAAEMRAKLMAIPPAFTREVDERRKLEAVVVDALNEIADAMDQKAAALEAGNVDAA